MATSKSAELLPGFPSSTVLVSFIYCTWLSRTWHFSPLHVYLCAANRVSRDGPDARAQLLTNALLGKGLHIGQLGRELLFAVLLLPQEREREHLPDRVVVCDELRRPVSLCRAALTVWDALPWPDGRCRDPNRQSAALNHRQFRGHCVAVTSATLTSILERVQEALVYELTVDQVSCCISEKKIASYYGRRTPRHHPAPSAEPAPRSAAAGRMGCSARCTHSRFPSCRQTPYETVSLGLDGT